MKLFNIFALLNLCQFNVLDGDVGELEQSNDAVVSDVLADSDEAQTPQEAVLQEMGLDEDSPKQEAPAIEHARTEATSEVALSEAKPKEITEADLEPLNSRNPATNERFHKLTEGFKQEKERATELQNKVMYYEDSIQSLRSLGFTDEESARDLVNFSQYRNALYSGDAKTLEAIIGNQIRQFEAAHGRKLNINANLLDMHSDLKGRVESLDLDEDTAFELARARTLQDRAARSDQVRYQNQQAQQQTKYMLDQSVQTIESLQRNWSETDPDYNAILPYLQPQMEEIGSQFPPNMWPKMIDIQYKTLKKALVENRQVSQREQPLRGNGFGGAKAVPSSPQQAVLQAMGLSE